MDTYLKYQSSVEIETIYDRNLITFGPGVTPYERNLPLSDIGVDNVGLNSHTSLYTNYLILSFDVVSFPEDWLLPFRRSSVRLSGRRRTGVLRDV